MMGRTPRTSLALATETISYQRANLLPSTIFGIAGTMKTPSRWSDLSPRSVVYFLGGVLVGVAIGTPAVAANTTTTMAPCHSFQKLPDGKWKVLNGINIEHGHTKTMLHSGDVINIGMSVSGVDLYAALEKNCGTANKSN
jgi:hypothetical protein